MKRPSRPPAHTRYLSSPAEATLHGKTQGFVLRLPPEHKPHATFMQPLQCVSQHHVANLHVSITWQHQMTTIMQPFHSDLQAQIRDTHRTTHTGTTTRCRTQRGTHSRMKRPSRPPAHTRYLSSPAEATLYTEKHKVSCSGFLPNTSPRQHPCNHYNAFRSITSQTGTSLRTWQHQMTTIMQPFHSDLQAQIQDTHRTTHTGTTLVAEHRGGTHSRMKRPSRPPAHTRYLSSPAEATLHGKTQGFVLRLPPQHKPHATFMQPLQCVSQHHVANLHVSTHMATPDDNNHAAIPQRSASTDSRHA